MLKDTVKFNEFTFSVKRYGLSAGCWWISSKLAKEICMKFGLTLPDCDQEVTLEKENKISNIGGSYLLTLYSGYTLKKPVKTKAKSKPKPKNKK